MNRTILSVCLLLISSIAFSQTSTSTTRLNIADSADFYLQKGIQEKEKGRRMESLKGGIDRACFCVYGLASLFSCTRNI